MNFVIYDATTGEIKKSVTCDSAQLEAQVAAGESVICITQNDVSDDLHFVNTVNGTLVEKGLKPSKFHQFNWLTKTWTIPSEALNTKRKDVSSALTKACRQQIFSGFESSALGAAHTYPSKETDQANLQASVLASLFPGLPVDWTTPFWCCDAAGLWSLKPHTVAQIQQVGLDGKAAILSCIQRNEQLQQQVLAADFVGLDQISWLMPPV